MEKLYDVLPGFDWVAGGRVPANRQVPLTDAAAAFDLALGRIVLATGQPPVQPAPAQVLDGDVLLGRRGVLPHTVTVAELGAHVAQGLVEGDGVAAVVSLSQAAYDALATKDDATLYVVL